MLAGPVERLQSGGVFFWIVGVQLFEAMFVVTWRLSVLDLATLKVHHLAETRSVDDQVEWLNNTTIVYGVLANPAIAALNPLSPTTPSLANGAALATNTWSVPADGGGSPHLFNTGTWSEVVTNR